MPSSKPAGLKDRVDRELAAAEGAAVGLPLRAGDAVLVGAEDATGPVHREAHLRAGRAAELKRRANPVFATCISSLWLCVQHFLMTLNTAAPNDHPP